MLNAEPQLRQADVLLDFDILVLERPPETFHFSIVQATAPAIHADLNVSASKFVNELRTGKLAALIGIEYLRSSECADRHLQRFHAMKRIHRVDYVIRHDFSAEQVHDADHESPMTGDSGIGDVRRPYLIRAVDFELAQEIWELLMFRVRLRGVEARARINRSQAQRFLQTPNSFVVDLAAASFQLRRQPGNAVKRGILINVHDFVLGLFV
ncbi:hypothetical protein SDC9_130966 [bioreactor metagenome]|uniref:Uncharacterized protein n=1 Tax=bioreactor metagenome TaxID=1076179 RepID=A0A645D3E9_9ZZZZ